MPLPEDFSPWEHLQDVNRRIHNRRVREFFSDLGGDDWEPNIGTSRASLRTACTMLDTDTAPMTVIRMNLFYFVAENFGRAQNPIYGLPVTGFDIERKYKPQILLYFQEDFQDVDPEYDPVDARISFRLMDKSAETLSQAEINAYALKVKNLFANGGGFVLKKGKIGCSYTNKERGYQLQLACRTKEEGKRVVEQVLDIQGHTPNWKYFNHKENEDPSEAYPTIPPTQVIAGKTYKEPRRLPIADVRFQYASLSVWGGKVPFMLCDRTGLFIQAIEKTY